MQRPLSMCQHLKVEQRESSSETESAIHCATAYAPRTGCPQQQKSSAMSICGPGSCCWQDYSHESSWRVRLSMIGCEVCLDERPCVTRLSISLLVIRRIATSKAWQEEKNEDHPMALTKHAAASVPLQSIKNAPWVSTISNADSNCSANLCMHHKA